MINKFWNSLAIFFTGSFSTSEKCNNCNGSGSKPGHDVGSCSMCGGHGQVRSSQGFFTVQQTCPQCSGSGEEITNPCNDCSGQGKKQASKKLSVTIPKGVDDGTRIRLAGKGEAGSRGSGSGDLYLFIILFSVRLTNLKFLSDLADLINCWPIFPMQPVIAKLIFFIKW